MAVLVSERHAHVGPAVHHVHGLNSLQVVNFWDQRGIYVLYNDHGPYYVGKAFDQALGVRLRQHRKEASPHAGRWIASPGLVGDGS